MKRIYVSMFAAAIALGVAVPAMLLRSADATPQETKAAAPCCPAH